MRDRDEHPEFAGTEGRVVIGIVRGEVECLGGLELTTVELETPGAAKPFEAALGAAQSTLQSETLWFRMVAGGSVPRYVRLRPRPSLAAVLGTATDQALPNVVHPSIAKMTVEILNLRPTMSLGLEPPTRE